MGLAIPKQIPGNKEIELAWIRRWMQEMQAIQRKRDSLDLEAALLLEERDRMNVQLAELQKVFDDWRAMKLGEIV